VFGGGERMTGYDNIAISEIPLPGTLGLMGLGLTALGALKRRKLSAVG